MIFPANSVIDAILWSAGVITCAASNCALPARLGPPMSALRSNAPTAAGLSAAVANVHAIKKTPIPGATADRKWCMTRVKRIPELVATREMAHGARWER